MRLVRALSWTALNDALRAVLLEGEDLSAQLVRIAILVAWGGISFVVALRLFRGNGGGAERSKHRCEPDRLAGPLPPRARRRSPRLNPGFVSARRAPRNVSIRRLREFRDWPMTGGDPPARSKRGSP